jgi:hypothetical protein
MKSKMCISPLFVNEAIILGFYGIYLALFTSPSWLILVSISILLSPVAFPIPLYSPGLYSEESCYTSASRGNRTLIRVNYTFAIISELVSLSDVLVPIINLCIE